MKLQFLSSGALAALAFAAPLMAQTVTLPGGVIPTAIVLQQTFTTGMVGITTNQTARINVLNLNSVATTTGSPTAAANCTVELQFFDDKGSQVGQSSTVPNFAPGTSTHFDLPRASITSETATRAEIRGVVIVNPTSAQATTSAAAAGNCSVITTLEVFDSNTGSTISLTSDTRAIGLVSVATLLTGLL